MEPRSASVLPQGGPNIWIDRLVKKVPVLESTGTKLASTLHEAVMRGGKPTRTLADILHGTWMGHSLHVILTDFTIGAWSLGVLFDAIAAIKGKREAERAADMLIATGNVFSIPTILAGLADFSTVDKPATSTATLHAILNDVNLALFTLSSLDRKLGKRGRGILLSAIGINLLLVSAWLGGHLVYSHRMGVNRGQEFTGLDDWTDTLSEKDLRENEPQVVHIEGQKILLYRCDGIVYAIDGQCSHAGGPLDEGQFHDNCAVQCPWHDSVFDLRTGAVVHGPATQPQTVFETRTRDGQIQIRIRA